MKVVRLPEDTVRRIAAGEVVERPASVLKELLENALDAGARRVTVEWREAGRKLLRVSDDGCGMSPADARLALERHATSKLKSLDDLERLDTFGFRGEALPSIASVSRFELVTREAAAPEAWRIRTEGGADVEEGPAGAPPGTSVTVEDLFHNVPARKKFLKSDGTERAFLLRVAEDAALSAGDVSLRVLSEGKEALAFHSPRPDTSPEECLRERLAEAWGRERTEGLRPVREEGRWMTVWGWISDVHASQPTGRYQRFYVNGRPVTSRRFTRLLYEAYRGGLMVGRHPLAALFLEVDPAEVDVNVHPAKREVRFSKEEEACGFLFKALQGALSGASRMAEAAAPPAAPSSGEIVFSGPTPRRFTPTSAESRAAYALQSPPSAPAPTTAPEEGAALTRERFQESAFDALAQAEGTYIIARRGEELYIFDQHAAAERALYERLSESAAGVEPGRQALLLPWVWEPSAPVAAAASERLEDFNRLGYGLEPFGARAFRVKAVPAALGDSSRVRGLLEGLAEDLASGATAKSWDAIVVRAACRGSVKAGDALQKPEMDRLIKDLQRCHHPWSCPHGRPTFLRLSAEELARRFRRT